MLVADLQAAGVAIPAPPRADVYVACADLSMRESVFRLTQDLRDAGISAEMDHQSRSLKGQLKQADRLSAPHVLIAGPEELADGEVTLRNMHTKGQTRVRLADVVVHMSELVGKEPD